MQIGQLLKQYMNFVVCMRMLNVIVNNSIYYHNRIMKWMAFCYNINGLWLNHVYEYVFSFATVHVKQ